MRFVIALVLGGALALGGCDSDEGSNGTGGSGGMGGGAAPVITLVEWSTPAGCIDFMDSNYTVVVTATDADSDQMDLDYAGSVTNCTGAIDDATSVISCPNNAPYGGMVVVSDGDGNESAQVDFTIDQCDESGSFTP